MSLGRKTWPIKAEVLCVGSLILALNLHCGLADVQTINTLFFTILSVIDEFAVTMNNMTDIEYTHSG